MPNNTTVKDIKPQFASIGVTKAVFQSSSVTYNDPTVTYSSATTQYGGSDNKQDPSPRTLGINDIKPENISVINL